MSIADDDRGFTLGFGLFETVLWEWGGLVFWHEHMARLARGCDGLGLPAPDAGVCESRALAAAHVLAAPRAAIRLSWSAGPGGRGLDPSPPRPHLVVSAAPAPHHATPARLATVSIRRNETSPASRLKTLSYLDNLIARSEARASGADEALMLNTGGQVACAAAANVIWERDGRLFTPALTCGVLDGIVRAAVMAAFPVEEVTVGPEALAGADAIVLTSSLIGVRAVSHLDGRPCASEALAVRLGDALAVQR